MNYAINEFYEIGFESIKEISKTNIFNPRVQRAKDKSKWISERILNRIILIKEIN